MYAYDAHDRAFIAERVERFRDQVGRRLSGQLSEEEFAPLRLQNGLYSQRHAYMLRVAIPYGTLSAAQLRALADIAERYDRGYGHFTTRQNIQFNWLELRDVPDLLADLAAADMHAVQTSGNCIRNITTDAFAGAAADEIIDPRPTAELLRQWSTLHPEFAHLPRKFKIAISAAARDRAAVLFHDIGLRIKTSNGALGFEIVVGGGQGRTPAIGRVLDAFVPLDALLPRLESILRVYNLHGRRDNKYKARIKVLIKSLGLEQFRYEVDQDYRYTVHTDFRLAGAELARIERHFEFPGTTQASTAAPARTETPNDAAFLRWLRYNTEAHKVPGYRIAVVSLKGRGHVPGDLDARRMRALASLAECFGHGELRVSHEQNLVLPHVRRAALFPLWQALEELDLGGAHQGLLTDLIACPGLDYCNLANARSIPLAAALSERFGDADTLGDIGPLAVRISGCVNACGHHHAGHIGILGVDKGGREYYQLTLGGMAGNDAAIGERLGAAVDASSVIELVEHLVAYYRSIRKDGETFIEAVRRTGTKPFKEYVDAACR